ncbi:MAG: hypothetical protein VYE64_04560 [Planctomycetota bacterium]|nr:hypothetical protein [Planctomycetota bacterium]
MIRSAALFFIGMFLLSLVLLPANARSREGHPVSVVEADIYVTKFKATIKLKAFAEDLELLQGIEALDDGFYDSDELGDATEDHADYLAERIELITADGLKLPAKIVEISQFEIPDEGIRQGQLMNYTMGFVLEYDFEEPPEFITINQRMVAEGMLLPSELKVMLKQAGSDQPFMKMMKPDQPETFRFDWDDPALRSDASDEDWESWFEKQREKTLGIQSYSSVYSFIYITHYEVRHEVLIPLANLASFLDLTRDDPGFLDIEEQDAAAEKIKAFFASGNPVKIDGVEVQPTFDRVDFYGLDLRDFAVQAERRKVSMANGRVGVIMSYSTKGMPTSVSVTWDLFNDAVKSVDSVVFAFDEIQKTEFTMFLTDNTFEWQATDMAPVAPISGVTTDAERYATPMLSVPLVSLVFGCVFLACLVVSLVGRCSWRTGLVVMAVCLLAGLATWNVQVREVKNPFVARPEVPADQAGQIFSQLHKNIFRAFDYRNEEEIYNALSQSVDGDLLRDLYLQMIESLKVKEQGGAVSNIREVNIVAGQALPSEPAAGGSVDHPGFGFRSQWDLIGTVEHWGHIHERTNKYDAQFQVELIGDRWKITEMQVLDESQGPVKTSLRKF